MNGETPPRPAPATQDRLFALLAELGIETTTHRHRPVFTVEESRDLRGLMPGAHCKSLFLKDKKSVLWLVVALEDRKLDLKALGAIIGSARLSFASPDRLMEYLGVIPGSVTPFALINDRERHVRVILDADIIAADIANFHPLSNDATTAIPPGGLLRFISHCGHEPQIVDLSGAGESAI
ncbi:MAG: prolyl-tRNA synthetase associated domain-containing protein [Rhodospirillales bacterium]|nr:prolyl-tRNA synthetase associated domain-containing protein [Rhodospirillales bacterium]